ncbi:MAG: bifunctional diguanylate cyclase/phosphodiesterase [Pontibacterium sp.]
MRLSQSISTRVSVWVAVIVMVAGIVLSESLSRMAQAHLQRQQSVLLESLAQSLASRLSQNMISRAQEVTLLSRLPQLTDPSIPLVEKQAFLQQVQQLYPQYTFLGLTDEKGIILTDVYDLLAGKSVAQRDWFTQAQQSLAFVDVHDAFLLGEHLPKPAYGDGLLRLVDISAPLQNASGEFMGVLGAHLSLDWAYQARDALLQTVTDPHVQLIIYNSRGEYLLGSQNISPEEPPVSAQFTNLSAQGASLVQWPGGAENLSAVATVSEQAGLTPLPWQVVVYKPAEEAFAPAALLRLTILWSGMVFATFLAFVLSRLIHTRLVPLRKVSEAADGLRKGRLDTPIPSYSGQDEIARFSRSLSKLVAALQKKNTELRLNNRVFEQARQAIVILDVEGVIVRVNHAFERVTGYRFSEARGNSLSLIHSKRHSLAFYQHKWSTVVNEGQWQDEVWYQRKDGTTYPVMLSLSRLNDDTGNISHYVAMFDDITEQLAQQDQLLRLANYDGLTGLPNRHLLEKRLMAALENTSSAIDTFALLFIDLDNFKNINDFAGHSCGDQVLREVSARFLDCLGNDVTLSRWGGDEFVLLLHEAGAGYAKQVAERLLSSLALPFIVDQQAHFISASIGISLHPETGGGIEGLMRCADAAMYHAKKEGKNRVQVFNENIDHELSDLLKTENRLRLALANPSGGLSVVFQPQFSMDGAYVVGAEALLRWHDAELGDVSPEVFIRVAEQAQLMVKLGEIAIDRALADFRSFLSAACWPFTLSLNISTVQLASDTFLENLEGVVKRYHVPRHLVCLEITETSLMTEHRKVINLLNRIKELGYLISVDDFGTGHSSLQYLNTFKPHEIKLDRNFVQTIDEDEYSQNIVVFTMSLAKGLGMKPVAEGVETVEQLDALSAIGDFSVQGYLYGRPMVYEDFYKLISQPEAERSEAI